MSNILCVLFGHRQRLYIKRGSYSPGEKYMKVIPYAIDASGREYANITTDCPRCGENYTVGKIHLPQRTAERELLAMCRRAQDARKE